MEWSAEAAMREMWAQYPDTWRTKNGDMMRFFKTHLQMAFDAGKIEMVKMDNTWIEKLEDAIKLVFRELGEEAAKAICVGEMKPFGDAVVALEKRRTESARQ